MSEALFSFNNTVLPAPSLLDNSIAVIKLTDPVLYTLAIFFGELLQTNLMQRFSEEAVHCGLTHTALDNFLDGYAVAQITSFPLHNLTLKENDFKFPMLNVVCESEEPHQQTLTNSALIRHFCVSWVLPPLTARQYNRLYHFLGVASKVFLAYGQQGYDPKGSVFNRTNNAWGSCNVAFGTLDDVSYEHFYGFDKAGQEVDFPAVQFRLSLFEQNQLPVPQNYPIPFNSISMLRLNLIDGYAPGDPINDFIDGYVFPNLLISSCSPSSGSIVGGTILSITGTGFDKVKLQNASQLTICGIPASNVSILSPTLMKAVTSPTMNVKLGNLVFTDLAGVSASLTNAYAYT